MLSTRYMVPDTDSPPSKANSLIPNWLRRLSLTGRILAINIFALLLLAGSFLYLDSFRARLMEERIAQAKTEIDFVAAALEHTTGIARNNLLTRLLSVTTARIRYVSSTGALLFDSWAVSAPTFQIDDPGQEPWQRNFARGLDDGIDFLVGAPDLKPFRGFDVPKIAEDRLELAPDRTHVITGSRPIIGTDGGMLIMDRNARDIRRLVRAERSRLGVIIAWISGLSVLLSLFLARTIARPLRLLAGAAAQVQTGRAREVVVPRLPDRQDEIGQLARALSNMNHALQIRIDATEAFAADVAHEIKNPLASLTSAAQTLASVKDKSLQAELIRVINSDVKRLDRLISEISELSRIDSQMARTTFVKIDLSRLLEAMAKDYQNRDPVHPKIIFARPRYGVAMINGDPLRLERAFANLIDNAASFSPDNGSIKIAATRAENSVIVTVQDDGPGIPAGAQEKIFERFHSDRPDGASFGRHSGLGLAITRAIIEAHDGSVHAENRDDGLSGAKFIVKFNARG